MKIVTRRNVAEFVNNDEAFRRFYECEASCGIALPPVAEYKRVVERVFQEPYFVEGGELYAYALLRSRDAVVAKCVLLVDDWNVCTIEGVCVHGEHRGLGHCKALVSAVRDKTASKFRNLRVKCYSTNKAAFGCYRSVFGDPVFVGRHMSAFELR